MSLFSTLGKIAGVVGSVLPGPIGTVAKTVGGALSGTSSGGFSGQYLPGVLKASTPLALPGGKAIQDPGKPSIFTQGLPSIDSVKVTQSGAGLGPLGGFIGSQTATFYPTTQNGASCGASQRGTHLNRTGYFLKNGQYVAPGTKCVANRRRNPLNPRALSRAMSRLSSAKKAVKALDRFEIKGRRR